MGALRGPLIAFGIALVAGAAVAACGPAIDGCWDPDPDCTRMGGHWDEGCKNCLGLAANGGASSASASPEPICGDEVDAGVAPIDAGDGACGEASCVPVMERGIGSHFTGLGCTGIESYYTPYNGCDGIRRSWDGQGLAGTIVRTETNRSFKTDRGICRDDWPAGNTLSGFVRIYR